MCLFQKQETLLKQVMSKKNQLKNKPSLIAIMNMFKDLQGYMNKSFNEDIERANKQLNEVMRTSQEIKADRINKETELLKEIQTEVTLEMKNLLR